MRKNDANMSANRARVLVYAYLNVNLGDDLFVRMLADRYPSVDFYVFSSLDYERIVGRDNLHVIRRNRINRIFSSHLPYQYWFRRFDAMVYIGGSIFMERGESGECTTTRLLDKFHKSFPEVPIHIIGSNYGPEHTPAFRNKVKQVFEFVESVCLRDTNSHKLFAYNPKVSCAADVVFGYVPQGEVELQSGRVGLSIIDLDIRPSIAKFRDSYEQTMARIVEQYCRQGQTVSLLSFCSAEGDDRACQRIVAQLPTSCVPNVQIVRYEGELDRFIDHLRSLEVLYATRFHATILGALFGIATLPIIYSDKTKFVLEDMGWTGATLDLRTELSEVENLTPHTLDKTTIQTLQKSSQNQFAALDKTLVR